MIKQITKEDLLTFPDSIVLSDCAKLLFIKNNGIALKYYNQRYESVEGLSRQIRIAMKFYKFDTVCIAYMVAFISPSENMAVKYTDNVETLEIPVDFLLP